MGRIVKVETPTEFRIKMLVTPQYSIARGASKRCNPKTLTGLLRWYVGLVFAVVVRSQVDADKLITITTHELLYPVIAYPLERRTVRGFNDLRFEQSSIELGYFRFWYCLDQFVDQIFGCHTFGLSLKIGADTMS